MAVVVVVLDSVTSIFSGFVFLTYITSMSSRLGQPVEEFTELRGDRQCVIICHYYSILLWVASSLLSFSLSLLSLGYSDLSSSLDGQKDHGEILFLIHRTYDLELSSSLLSRCQAFFFTLFF